MRQNLKEAREKRSLTQEALAKELGIAEITVRSLENGKRAPSTSMAVKYASFFSCSLEFLFPDIFLLNDDTKHIV